MKTITMTISPVGQIKTAADGFKGSGCAEATKRITDQLGGAADTAELPAMHEVEEEGEELEA